MRFDDDLFVLGCSLVVLVIYCSTPVCLLVFDCLLVFSLVVCWFMIGVICFV